MDKQTKNRLPKECLFINADGEIMKIEHGKSGFRRSELSTENKKANREIVNSYNERHGITAEQVKRMHHGALFGWDATQPLRQEESGAKNGRMFEVEISRPGSFGAETSATLTLPAAPYEILDALDKARITDERVIYSAEIISCELDYLPQFISPSVNLYELNHLSQRLASLNQWELDCFEGVTMMDAIQTKYAPIAVERLINMTYSLESCQVVHEAHDDSTLGKFYADNDFVQKLENVPDEIYECLDFGKIGKEMREGEGGVFTPHGYVVQNGEIAKTYQSGDAALPEKPDYAILLSVRKGYFNDPAYDNDLCVQLKLPADDAAISQAAEAVDAASLRECAFHVEDCAVPQLCELITDELEDCNGDITVVDAFAGQLRKLDREGRLPVYKAMLEAAPKDLSLDEAVDLAEQAADFQLLREIPSPLEYAQAEILKHDIPLKDELIGSRDLYSYGQKLMDAQGAVGTEYGILLSEDGVTVEQCLGRPDQHMEMR